MRTQKVRHVLDDADHRHFEFLEHLDAFDHIRERDILRRRDDHAAGERDGLRQRQLHIAGAGRQINHEVIEIAPIHIGEKLANRAMQHRTAPDHRLLRRNQETHGH